MGSLRYFNLSAIKALFNTPIFFETGAGKGTGIEYAATCDFREIYSVEIVAEQAKHLSQYFAHDPRIRLINGRSDDMLREWLPRLKDNTLFFLDAHFPGADLGLRGFDDEQDEDLRLPLFNELKLIKELRADKGFKDVILIDDLMIFDDDHVYPDSHLKKEHAISAKKLANGYKQLLGVLDATHKHEIFPAFSGYVIISPR